MKCFLFALFVFDGVVQRFDDSFPYNYPNLGMWISSKYFTQIYALNVLLKMKAELLFALIEL